MPRKPLPEGEKPPPEKYNSGLRMLREQNIFYKFYAAHVMRGTTDRSSLMRGALNDHIKKLEANLTPEDKAVLAQMAEEEEALVARRKKERGKNAAPKKRGRPSTASVFSEEEKKAIEKGSQHAVPRPKKVGRKVRASA